MQTADERHRACRSWRNRLSQEFAIYKGHVQGMAAVSERGVPDAIAIIERMLVNLEAYVKGEGGAGEAINELIKESERQAAMTRTVTEELDTTEGDAVQDAPAEDRGTER